MFDYLELLRTNKELNDEQLHLIIKEEIEGNNLHNYVDNINISSNNNYHGYYFKKELCINPKRILKLCYACSTNELSLRKMPLHKIYNMYALLIIYHEINHAIQTRESTKKEDDAIHQIIKEGIELGNKDIKNYSFNDKLINMFFYKKMLIERNAEIMAVSKIISENEDKDFLNKEQLNYLKDYLKYLLKYGYSKKKNPAKTYYKLRGKLDEYNQLMFDKNKDLLETLSYGLPLNYELVKEVSNNLKMLKYKKV